MKEPQPGVFKEGTTYHYHLEYRSIENVNLSMVARAYNAATRNLGPDGQIVVGFRPSLWLKMMSWNADENFQDFRAIEGVQGFTAPRTQNDVWFWLHSDSHDRNFEAARFIQWAMQQSALARLEIFGFARYQNRDLTGFVIGSANPSGPARYRTVVIPHDGVGAGGSFALTQKWVHDLASFNALSIRDQEATIGRTKADGIELEEGIMPPDCHISRMAARKDDAHIYRRSTPYGSVREHGLYFVGFACGQSYLQTRLDRMFGHGEDGLHDRLIHFCRAVTGSYWFVPALQDLKEALR